MKSEYDLWSPYNAGLEGENNEHGGENEGWGLVLKEKRIRRKEDTQLVCLDLLFRQKKN